MPCAGQSRDAVVLSALFLEKTGERHFGLHPPFADETLEAWSYSRSPWVLGPQGGPSLAGPGGLCSVGSDSLCAASGGKGRQPVKPNLVSCGGWSASVMTTSGKV